MRLGANQQPIVDPGTGIRWQPCKNVSGEVIPPHAVVRFACMNDDGALDVDKVNGDLIAHGVTNHDAIPVDGYGFVTATFPNWARVDLDGVDATGSASASASSGASSGSGGPIVDCGAFLGVREGSWSLHLARAGASGGSSGSASGSSGSASGSSSGGGASGDENNAPPAQYQACSPAKNDPPRIYVVALGGSGGSRIRVKIPICVSLQPDIADPSGGSSGSPSGSASATGTGGTRSGGHGDRVMSGSASGSASGRTVFASGDPDPILTNPPPGWKWVIEYQDYLIDADDLGEVCEVALVCCPPPVGPPPNPSGTGGSGTFSGGTSGNGSGTSSGGGGGSSGGGTGTGSGGDGYCFCGSHDFAITGGGGGGSSGGSGTFGTGDPTGSGSGDDDCEEVEDDPNSPPLWWLQIFRVLTCNAFYLDPNVCTCVQFYIDHPRPDGTYGPSSPQPCDSIYWPVILAAWQAFLQQHPGGTLLHCLGVDIPASYGPPVSDLKYIDVEFVGRKIGKSYCRDLEDCECP